MLRKSPKFAPPEKLAEVKAAKSEAAALKILWPEIRRAVEERAEDASDVNKEDAVGVSVYDSESIPWLPQNQHQKEGGRAGRYRPDGFTIFWAFAFVKVGQDQVYQGARPALDELFENVRAIIEGKKFAAFSNEATGQVLDCVEKFWMLYNVPIMNAICIDREYFRLLTVTHGYSISYICDGQLKDGGSREAIAKHPLGFVGADNKRRIDTLECISTSAFRIAKGWGLTPRQSPVLGQGASGTVFAMSQDAVRIAVEAGGDAESQVQEEYCLKVAPGAPEISRLETEFEVHKLIAGTEVQKLVVSMDLEKFYKVADDTAPEFACAAYTKVGNPINMGQLGKALTTLFNFHSEGWVHGDARVANFICVGNEVYLIDLATSCKDTRNVNRHHDFATFALSVLGLPLWGTRVSWKSAFGNKFKEVVTSISKLFTGGSDNEKVLRELAALLGNSNL